MLSPLRVSRVTPPSTTIEYTHAEHPASHTPSAVDCAAVILRAIGLTRPAAAAAEEATTFFAADAVCAPRKAAPADPGAMVTVLLLLLLLLLDEKFLYCDKTDGFDDAFDDDAAAAANPLSATCLLFIWCDDEKNERAAAEDKEEGTTVLFRDRDPKADEPTLEAAPPPRAHETATNNPEPEVYPEPEGALLERARDIIME